jgi:hypothetical protein
MDGFKAAGHNNDLRIDDIFAIKMTGLRALKPSIRHLV